MGVTASVLWAPALAIGTETRVRLASGPAAALADARLVRQDGEVAMDELADDESDSVVRPSRPGVRGRRGGRVRTVRVSCRDVPPYVVPGVFAHGANGIPTLIETPCPR